MSRHRFAQPAAAGFTLTEMLVAMTIAAIALSIGMPSFTSMVARYRVDGQHVGLMDDLLLAREEARNSSSPTAVCASSNGSSCNGSAWNQGHIVFRDAGVKGTVDAGDTVLRYAQAAPAGITMVPAMQATGDAYGKTYVLFDADGKVDSSGAIIFTTCLPGNLPMQLTLQRNGYMTAAKGAAAC
jgi:type IV fimbrial biogenesis protein FimT